MRKKYEMIEIVQFYEVKIVVTRKFKFLWLDYKEKYLSYKFSKHLRVKEIVPQTFILRNAIVVWSIW
jgi:hypothetical protein